jgi:hypothetical protein
MRPAFLSTPLEPPRVNWKVVAGLVLAAIIAWATPFDLAFGAATFGLPILRAAAIVALALIGLRVGGRIGLGVEAKGLGRPILTPLAVAAVVAVGCVAADGLFRAVLQPAYVHSMSTAPLAMRIAGYMMRAFNENIIYRLFLGSVLVCLIGRRWKTDDGRPTDGAYWLGFALAQGANIWINVTSQAPLTPLGVLHDALRYFAPGMVWSWLYWRHGFQSNEIACTGVHLFFQPLSVLGLK